MGKYRAHARVAVVVAVTTSACAAIEGLDHYGPGSGSDAATDGRVGTGDVNEGDAAPDAIGEEGVSDDAESDVSQGGADSDVAMAVSDAPPSTDDAPDYDAGNCMTAMVDPVHGIFVAQGGNDNGGAGCGTAPTSPCASIGAGIATATKRTDGAMRNIVYVSAGLYTEKLSLAGGVTVQGGWLWGGAADWTFPCTDVPESAVVVQAPSTSNMTIVANGNNGTATLSTLTVLSKAESDVQPGESLYGIYATAANTEVMLTDVVVTMQAGGAGKAGTAGAPASAPGTCSVGDGQSAAASTAGAVGSAGAAGTFSSTGFTTHTGGTGGNGAAGDNGPAGQAATPIQYMACISVTPNCTQGMVNCTGGAGVNGCGGGAGQGGGGGGGGGSSVAVFAYDATVVITAGGLVAGNGGNGGAGGSGTQAAGSPGTVGAPTVCPTSSCTSSTMCMSSGTTVAAQGGMAPASGGGQGSAGGAGGGGAGGDSWVIMTGGLATGRLNLLGSPVLRHGNQGTGGMGNGPNGAAGPQGTF